MSKYYANGWIGSWIMLLMFLELWNSLFYYLTWQEIYKDRKKFSRQVFEVASSDLVNMGITVVSYTLKDVRDEMVSSMFPSLFE